jgi:hypothetical protein
MRCPSCNEEIPYEATLCENCGSIIPEEIRFSEAPAQPSSSKITEDDFRSFIGKNAEKYIRKFKKFEAGGRDKFQASWHWPAFFFGWLWFVYRRLYLWALLVFAIGLISSFTMRVLEVKTNGISGIFFGFVVGIVIMIIWGTSANYIYYIKTKEKITELKNLYPSEKHRQAELPRAGGVNRIAIVIPLALFIIIFLTVLSVPVYIMYRAGCCDTAQTSVRMAYIAAQTFYIKNQNENITNIRQLKDFGFNQYESVSLNLLNGNSDNLIISSKGRFCNKTYYADYAGKISETRPALPTIPAVAPPPDPVTTAAPTPSPTAAVAPALTTVQAADIVKPPVSSGVRRSE